MKTYIITKTGHRNGCYSIDLVATAKRGDVTEARTYFLIDEPGAWFEDKWNCHVDGTDYEFDTKEEAIRWGFHVEGIDLDGVQIYEQIDL